MGKEGEVVDLKRYVNLSGLKTILIILKLLGLDSKYPTELIMPLLNKITKSGILRSNIGAKGYLLLLGGPKGGLEVSIVRGG